MGKIVVRDPSMDDGVISYITEEVKEVLKSLPPFQSFKDYIHSILQFADHVGDDKLPSEVSKTSQPMKWNQPPKKEIAPARAQDIVFIKPSHTDSKLVDEVQCNYRSQFDPRHPLHRTIQEDKLQTLLSNLQKTLPGMRLQQFWLNRS